MRKLFVVTFVIALAAAVAAGPVLAKSMTFKVRETSSINGTDLEPGTYKIKLNGNSEAEIYRNNKKLMTAQVEVKPLAKGRSRSSVLRAADGSISEIRFKNQVVIFVK